MVNYVLIEQLHYTQALFANNFITMFVYSQARPTTLLQLLCSER